MGMARGGASLGMQYVDPAPIATHTVSAEALEGKRMVLKHIWTLDH